EDLDGSNQVLERAETVERVRDLLAREATKLPRGATLLFDHVQVWSFGKDLGPRLWTGDPTLAVYPAADLHALPTGELAIVNSATHQGDLYTGARNQTWI